MRKIVFSIMFFTLAFVANAQNSGNDKVIFWASDFNMALDKAKAKGQLLFVECYSPNCPVCQSLEPLFKSNKIAQKYNDNFVSYKLNVERQEDVKYLSERNIWLPSFPMFLFFDGDGKIVHQSEVSPTIESLVSVADIALNSEKRAENFKKRFNEGERSLNFLINYASFSRVIRDTTAAITAGKEIFNSYPKDELGSETSWFITKKCIIDVENGFAQYWFNNFQSAKALEVKSGHSGGESTTFIHIIQGTLQGSRGQKYNTKQLNNVRQYMALIDAGQYADFYLWELETKANIREGNFEKALEVGNNIIAKFQENGAALVYITKVFNDNFPNNSYIPFAQTWLSNAQKTIKQDNQRAEYYFESARLYQKSGDLSNSKKEAKMALELANKSGVKNPKFTELIKEFD